MMGRKKLKPKFYIAHTFGERVTVRDELIPKLQKIGIITDNPFYNPDGSWKDSRPEVRLADELTSKGLNAEEIHEFTKKVRSNYENIVDTDLDMILDADGIIAYMQETSTGTTCEMWTCGGVFQWLAKKDMIPHRYLEAFLNKPVYLISRSSRFQFHPWIRYATVRVFKTQGGLVNHLKKEMPRLRIQVKERRKLEKSRN
jgi:hypothetical protein